MADDTSPILWRHPHPERTYMARFGRALLSIADDSSKTASASRPESSDGVPDYELLHRWSVQHRDEFWSRWLDESGIPWIGSSEPVLEVDDHPFVGARWFPNVWLNAAQAILHGALTAGATWTTAQEAPSGGHTVVTWDTPTVARWVIRVRKVLTDAGVTAGSRVVGVLPNGIEAVVAMLATVSIGATWAGASPDFGVTAILDRFAQIDPVVLIGTAGYRYGGRLHDVRERMTAVRDGLATLRLALLIAAPTSGGSSEVSSEGSSGRMAGVSPDAMADGFQPFPGAPQDDEPPAGAGHAAGRASELATSLTSLRDELAAWPEFRFDHPMYVLFSSGTTGTPKCIIHGAGGTILQHIKEHRLHGDCGPGDSVLFFTTCGWMMWNWLVSAPAAGASVVLYDGSPAWPETDALWDVASRLEVTHLGTSPRYLAACRRETVRPHALGHLRVLYSTGAPLLPEDFDYLHAVRPEMQIASISGGTDIISCFMLGNPLLPVRRGEIQAAGLGMDIAAVDALGAPVVGERAELVCRAPFPSRPVTFHGATREDGEARYRRAYFEGIRAPDGTPWWTHGDYIEITGSVGEIGGIVVYGRSDATLNPGGVRIGSAEIYRVVETVDGVDDALVVGVPYAGDEEVVLFVVSDRWAVAGAELTAQIRAAIRAALSPRHVPARVLPAPAVPYTRSGKKVEIAVRDILTGGQPPNRDALADPAVLDWYAGEGRRLLGETRGGAYIS